MTLTAISCLLLLTVDLTIATYIHIEDGLCVDLHDALNMGGEPSNVIKICGETIDSACGTAGDDDEPYANNPYDCKNCNTVTIYDGFPFDLSVATAEPTCQGVFTFPEDYGDVYYRDKRLYDAFGSQITSATCQPPITWGGKFVNPWNAYPNRIQPSPTPCPSPSSLSTSSPPTPPSPSASCYHFADPDQCPTQYSPGWCYCNDDGLLYPVRTDGGNPCGYTVLPSTTTTAAVCTGY